IWRRPLEWNLNGTTDPRDGSVDHLSLNSLKDCHGPIRAPKSLITEFNPTTMLAGNNVHPAAIVDPKTGALSEYPSSHPETMRQIYRLGFDLLEELHQQAT